MSGLVTVVARAKTYTYTAATAKARQSPPLSQTPSPAIAPGIRRPQPWPIDRPRANVARRRNPWIERQESKPWSVKAPNATEIRHLCTPRRAPSVSPMPPTATSAPIGNGLVHSPLPRKPRRHLPPPRTTTSRPTPLPSGHDTPSGRRDISNSKWSIYSPESCRLWPEGTATASSVTPSIPTTPSDQKPREQKSTPYQDSRYTTLLATKGSFMSGYCQGIAEASRTLCTTLLESQQPVPVDSVFRDDVFEKTCQKLLNKNEARIILDISRLIVPSAEILATFGDDHLDILIETVNAGWNNSVPLTGTRPQPDYSVAFRREAFTEDQLATLAPFLGNFLSGDQSFFMGNYEQYFPFLSSEVKCGAAGLDVADRQNAHSMTLAVRGVAELFRLVKRQDDAHRQILGFSISHDNLAVRIWGHYPVLVDGRDIEYYRHLVREFTITDGRDKWTAYRFVKNIYDIWMPAHFKRICSAIDQLPTDVDFDVASLPETSLFPRSGQPQPQP